MKNQNDYLIKLMGERRVKSFAIGMLLIMIILVLFISSLIHHRENDDLVLYLLLYGFNGFTIVGDISLLFNTERKLLGAQLLQGVFTIILALNLFVMFLFLLLGDKYVSVTLYCVLFILFLAILRWVLIKINHHNFKKSTKYGVSFIMCLIGAGIGRSIYVYIFK